MKAWILISFYLSKDIWRRWFETPGGVLSRLLVALILAILLIVIDAAFTLSAASIQEKISQMGVRTIFITRSVPPVEAESNPNHFWDLVDPLRKDGEVLRLLQVGRAAKDEFGTDHTVFVYDNKMLLSFFSSLPSDPELGVFVVSENVPPGMKTMVNISGGSDLPASFISTPSWLSKFNSNSNVVLVPQEQFPDLMRQGFFEMVVFLGNQQSDLIAIEENLLALIKMEGLNNVQMSSPKELIAQLDDLQSNQLRWRMGFGLFGGLAVALVFGSISILEYRQNRFILALLKSFGAPSTLLIARYLVESMVLVLVATILARTVAIWLHPIIFLSIGIEPNLVLREVIDPYTWSALISQFKGLALGAFLSVVPVAFAIRTPVGKILS